ncbi:MAG: PQQ-binding-like beta-propeller repeat protein, partial [Firmicutes bacterium]|nr:PQQ-binding-like beta-propeller repeat protein [Bacillota bacterium]
MKNISVKWAVIFVVFLAVFAAVLVLYFQASSAADVVHPAGFGTGLQNSGIFCNPSGSMIYVSAQDGSLTAFGENGEKSWELKTRGIVNDMAFDTVNGIAYVGSDDHNIYILNATTGEVLEKKDIGLKVYKLDVTPGGDMLLVSAGISSPKHKILLYDGHGNELLNIPAGTIVRAAGFNNDRTEFFTGDDNGNLRIYDLKGNILKSARMNSQIFAAQYTESGMYVYVKRGLFYTFDSDLNQTLQVQVSDPKVDGWAMAATPDDKWVGFAVSSPAKDAGVFILTNSDGAEQVSSHYDVPVTGIAVTDKHMYFTGPGDFIYRLDIDQMQTVKLLGQYKQLLFVLSLTLPIVLLFLLAMAVLSIRRVVRRFFEILYKHRLAYLLLLPTFALIAVFGYYPVFMAVTRAFTNWSARSPTIKFVGFENFVTMVKEGYFLTGVGNMLILLVAGLIKTLTVPLLVAKLINSLIKRRQKYWFRFLFVLPMIVPGIVTTLMWQNIYDPQVG